MVSVIKRGIILEHTDLEFENQAVLNPGCIKVGNDVHMLYRAVKKGNFSSIGYCKLKNGLKVVNRAKKPVLFSEFDYEKQGIEDPRIVKFGSKYYITYMGYNGRDVVGAYAVSKDLKNFEKKGIIFPLISFAEAMRLLKKTKQAKQAKRCTACFKIYHKGKTETKETTYIWGKDVVLFPRKINGKYALLHRVLPDVPMVYFKDFDELTPAYWKKHLRHLSKHIVLDAKYWFETNKIGAGCPPIETKKGWLVIYHTVEQTQKRSIKGTYRAAAALLDKKNPFKVIGRLEEPLFSPEEKWELKGDVNNVVFPTGAAVYGKRLHIYYGAADKRIALATVDINELLNELLKK